MVGCLNPPQGYSIAEIKLGGQTMGLLGGSGTPLWQAPWVPRGTLICG